MPGIARVGVDSAVGTIVGPGAVTVFCNGSPIATVGSLVAPHPPCGSEGEDAHCAATLIEGSGTVFACGIPVCRQGDAASCSDTVSPGSSDTFAGG